MTREEHIDQLITYLRGYSFCMVPASSEYWQKHWKEIREALSQGWIPCEEKLPEIGHNILITNRQGYTGEGEYKGHNGYHHVWYQYRWNATLWEDEVLAWMPLPKPYEGGQNDKARS